VKVRRARIICPIATPLDDRENLDVPSFRLLVERIVPHVDALFVLGSSAEMASLRTDVRPRVVAEAVDAVHGRVPILVGIGEASTSRALENIDRYVGPGIDGVVACGPYYFAAPDQGSLVRHFLAIAEQSPVPVILYNIPQYTGTALAPDPVRELAQHENIVGIKDSAGDLIVFQEFLASAGPGFAVYQGREHLAAASLWLGAAGIVSSLSNVAPAILGELAQAVEAGDREAALRLQRDVTSAARIFGVSHFVSGLKAALMLLGVGTGGSCGPMPELAPGELARVREALVEAGLLAPAGTA
jgi:dihydrodipicolinate synthase/N-acetylneuraminate lyase